jgi:uncharacterized protein
MVSLNDPATVLFGKTRRAILSLLFTRPDESFYLREIVRRTGGGIGAIQRELRQLTACGIVRREEDRFFRANPDSPIYEKLKQMVVRTMGMGDRLREALRPIEDRIVVAFAFGSFARGQQRESSDLDLMVITRDAGITLEKLAGLLSKEQERIGREINPFVLSSNEFRTKWFARNHFVHRVVEGEKIYLIGGADELKRLAEERVAQSAQGQRPGNRRPARAGKPRPQRRKGQRTQR